MKKLFRIAFIVVLFVTSLYANPFVEPLEKIHSILEKDVTKAIAVILIAFCGFYVSSGDFQRGKTYAWGLIIGISVVYGAKWIADANWG